jgi:hypothetical protein
MNRGLRTPVAVAMASLALGTAVLPVTALAGGRFASLRSSPSQGVGRPAGGGFHDARGLGGPVRHRVHGGRPLLHPVPGRFHAVPVATWSWFPSTALLAPTSVVYAPSPVPSAPVIVSPTVVYVQPGPAPVAVAPAPPPAPAVVEYATGRYELRGDGVVTPHTWAWVPNPPPAPPPSAGDGALAVSPPPAAGSTRIYRWTDEDGTTIWTNRPDAMPAPARAQDSPIGTPGDHPL